MSEKLGKENNTKWYPGKYASSALSYKVQPQDPPPLKDEDKDKKWYPGKLMSKAAKRASFLATDDKDDNRRGPECGGDGGSTMAVEDDKSREASVKKLPLFSTYEKIGSVRIKLPFIKYLAMNQANFLLEFEDTAAFFEFGDDYVAFDRTFELKDLSSDIVLTVSGTSVDLQPMVGIIIIPVTSLLGFSGQPLAPKETWMQIYPLPRDHKKERPKFVSGLADCPGHALVKQKESMGFVCVAAEVTFTCHPLWAYFSGEPRFGCEGRPSNSNSVLDKVIIRRLKFVFAFT